VVDMGPFKPEALTTSGPKAGIQQTPWNSTLKPVCVYPGRPGLSLAL
jgi:hypothetical protein